MKTKKENILITRHHKLLSEAFCFPAQASYVARLNIQETFIGNKLRDQFKPYGGGGWGCCERSCIKARSADHTILALFFQSSRIREGNHSRAGDRKHMSADSRRGTQNTGLRARRPKASVENIVCGAHRWHGCAIHAFVCL